MMAKNESQNEEMKDEEVRSDTFKVIA